MKVVILAAGLGSRLDHSPDHPPKALTKLYNGESLLEYQIRHLSPFVPLPSIFIVVGYKNEMITNRFPQVSYIFSPNFKHENTAKSLLNALQKIDDDLLWLNGDVIFHPSVIQKLILYGKTSMVVNRAECRDEEVKYKTDDARKIIEVSKEVQNPQGEALGINYFKKTDLHLLKKNLENCAATDYFEKGITMCIQQGQTVNCLIVEQNQCIEIDFPGDLTRANELLKLWNQSDQ